MPGRISSLSNNNLALCKRIRSLRISLGHTQGSFADLCNINKSTIKHIEVGIHLPTIDILRIIAKKCKVTYDYLIDGKKT